MERSILFKNSSVFFLTDDFEALRKKDSSRNLSELSSHLLDNVSTDDIAPVSSLFVQNIEELGKKALTGMDPQYGFSEGVLQNSGAEVLIAGKRFGSGSSREQAVWALKSAGIKAVIAESFGPVFARNADNLGLLISTDLSIAEKINYGEAIPFSTFLQNKDSLSQEIVSAGGLFPYLAASKNEKIIKLKNKDHISAGRAMNVYEQRLAGALGVSTVEIGESGILPVDVAYSYAVLSGLARDAMVSAYGKERRGIPADQVYFFEDHFALSLRPQIPSLNESQRRFARELGIPKENYFLGKIEEGGGKGICHRVMMEKIDPRKDKVVVATDSHVPTINSLPILAVPVGSTLWGAAVAEGVIPYSVLPVTRVEFTGNLSPILTIRDVQWELARQSVRKVDVIEYGGLGNLSFEQVAILCNVVPELFNAEMALTEVFSAGIEYLGEKYGIKKKEAEKLYGLPDDKSCYSQELSFDLSSTVPGIALPGNPRNTVPLSGLKETEKIDKAFIISCTSGLEEMRQAAAVLKESKIDKQTRLIIVPSSEEIRRKAEERGYIPILRQAGAEISDQIACGACIGETSGLLTENEVAVSTSNRNYFGRMGDKSARVYLAGGYVVALSAKLGRIPNAMDYKLEEKRILENLIMLNN